MTDDAYEQFLDDFGRQLERAAAAEPAPRRPRLRLTIATAGVTAMATAILAVALLGPSDNQGLDVLAEARAALAPGGEILHTVVRQSIELPRGHPRWMRTWTGGQEIEQWSTSTPRRWRTRIVPRGGGTYVAGDAALSGPFEIAYADGLETTNASGRGGVIVRPLAPAHSAGRAPGQLPGGEPDPVAAIRAFLARGTLKDRGAATVDGRHLRRLTGSVRVAGDVWLRLECFIDPATFVPAVARIQRIGSAMQPPRQWTPISVVRFVLVERLPLTPESERLLRIEPPSGAAAVRAHVDRVFEVARRSLRQLARERARLRRVSP